MRGKTDKHLRRTFRPPDMASSLPYPVPPNPPAVPSVFIPVHATQRHAPSSLQTVPSAWNVHSPLRAWMLPPVTPDSSVPAPPRPHRPLPGKPLTPRLSEPVSSAGSARPRHVTLFSCQLRGSLLGPGLPLQPPRPLRAPHRAGVRGHSWS